MDEHQQKLQEYIATQIRLGQSPDAIAAQLTAAGWQLDAVHQAFGAVQSQLIPSAMQPGAPQSGAQQVSDVPPLQANGNWRGRFKIGWQIFKQSIAILRGNKYLFRFFFMTWAWVIAVNIIAVAIVLIFFRVLSNSDGSENALWYVFAFINYVVIYFLVNFYTAALSSNILDLFKGVRQPYKHYVQQARSKAGPIFVYSLIASIIGMILQYIVERIRFVGQILAWLLGATWSLGTMFVLPIIMNEDKAAVPAIKESVFFLKQNWGENIIAKISVNLPIAIINILLAFVFFFVFFGAISSGVPAFIIATVIVYLLFAISLAVIGSFATNLVSVALYYYAVNRQIPPGFTAEMLNQVFVTRKRGLFGKKKQAASGPVNPIS